MSGPPYPPPPGAGSNAIGRFVIGESPIGDIPPFNIWETIISQYANSPRLTQLILNWDAYLDQTKNFDDLYDLIWNVVTAQGYGLDVWGRIVGVNRILTITANDFFGFTEAGAPGFGQARFYSGVNVTDNFVLNDETYRLLIFAKAAANITQGSIPAINQILINLFPNRGNAYVLEGEAATTYFGFKESTTALGFGQAPFYSGTAALRMRMFYTFEFPLTPLDLAIVNSGVLPKSTGVLASIRIIQR